MNKNTLQSNDGNTLTPIDYKYFTDEYNEPDDIEDVLEDIETWDNDE